MNVLIVHAHPEAKSFNTALMHQARQQLTEAGHNVEVSDLYEMNWNPVASADDFANRKNPEYLTYALEQRHNYEQQAIAPDIAAEVAKLQKADLLILNFPLFWFSVPAIMKGWIDRVLISGVCYGGMRFYDQGGLKGKKALVTLTLGGREHMFGEKAIHGDLVDGMLRPLLRGTLAYVGLEVLPPFIGYHIPYLKPEARQQILEDHKAYLANLDQLQPLRYPHMDEFDSKLYPLTQ